MAAQLTFLDPAGLPEGLVCGPELIAAAEERALIERMRELPMKSSPRFRGEGNRA